MCCFNHIIGITTKDGHDMPLLPYQKTLYDSLQNHKHIWIKKSRGLGVTELLLRYVAWSCMVGSFPNNARVCIVTGPRIDLAEDLIARFKGLCSEQFANDRTQSTVAFLNGVEEMLKKLLCNIWLRLLLEMEQISKRKCNLRELRSRFFSNRRIKYRHDVR